MAIAQRAIGTALRSLGPHIVLTALPVKLNTYTYTHIYTTI